MFKKFTVALGAAALLVGAAQAETITGAGGTFPAPIYLKWAEAYKAATGNALNYAAIGSGGGIKQIKAKTVDFGASDMPLKAEELNASGLMQFPTVIGGVVPAMNVPGLRPGQLKLTGAVLGDIYLGKVNRWNSPEIERLNPGLRLPNLPITVVHRSDGSGTSFIFTTYLSMKNREWATKVGAGTAVNWPVGLGGKGNDGVAAFTKQTLGAIGFVEYAYAKENHITYALMQNKAGKFVAPTAANFAAAGGSAPWGRAPGNYVLLIDQPGPHTWPISGATFILMYKHPANPAKSAEVLKFFDWSYKHGDRLAEQLDYVPLPLNVKRLIDRQWATEITAGGRPVYVAH